MSWRVANSILGLIGAVNVLAPGRSTASDGTIGDAAHSSRTSDHNPNVYGVVTAADITHDPSRGADMHQISETIRKERDHRVKYVIFDKQIFASYATSARKPWTWGAYSGVNTHEKHMHLSVVGDPKVYDMTEKWVVTGEPTIEEKNMPMLPLRRGDGMGAFEYKKSDVGAVQAMMNRAFNAGLKADGMYGDATVAAVKKYLGDSGEAVYGNLYDDLIDAVAVVAARRVLGSAGAGGVTEDQVKAIVESAKLQV